MKFIYENEAEIPSSLKEHYQKNAEGKWELQVEGAVPKAKIDEFRNKNIELSRELDTLKAQYKDVDPAKFAELKAKEKDLEEGKIMKKDGVDALVETRTKEMREDYERKMAAEKKRADEAEGALTNMRLDVSLRDVGTKLGVRKEAIGDLVLRGRGSLKFEDGKLIAYGDDGKKLYGASGDPMTVDEWAAQLTKTAPHLFEESKGQGAPGSGPGQGGKFQGPNPWKKETRNITAQMKIQKEDPDLAKRLMAAAKG